MLAPTSWQISIHCVTTGMDFSVTSQLHVYRLEWNALYVGLENPALTKIALGGVLERLKTSLRLDQEWNLDLVGFAVFSPFARSNWTLSVSQPFLLMYFLGRFNSDKGIDELEKAEVWSSQNVTTGPYATPPSRQHGD